MELEIENIEDEQKVEKQFEDSKEEKGQFFYCILCDLYKDTYYEQWNKNSH